MDMKWTPGPWIVEYKNGTTRIVADGEVTMCDETYYPWTPDNDADWHLIASAPDLYEALEYAYENVNADCGTAYIFKSMARDALAKARGEA